MLIRRGDLFWANLNPAQGSEQSGRRPVLVIQNDIGNQFAPTVIIAPVTTRRFANPYPVNVEVPSGVAGLTTPSTILGAQIRTIDKARLGHRIGRLPSPLMEQVNHAIGISLGLIS